MDVKQNSCSTVEQAVDDRPARCAPAVSSPQHATARLPFSDSDAFSVALNLPEDASMKQFLAAFSSAAPCDTKPMSVETDGTKCLIRALRARVDPPLASATDLKSLHPRVRALQKTQRAQHNKFKIQGQGDQRRRQVAPSAAASASGKRVSSVSKTGTRAESDAKRAQPDRMLFGSVGVVNNIVAQGLGAAKWEAATRECRQACIRASLTAAVCHSPSPALAEMHRIWEEDPSRKQSVTSGVRRELADTVPSWSMLELQAYLASVDVASRRLTSRREMVGFIVNHLRPPARLAGGPHRRDR